MIKNMTIKSDKHNSDSKLTILKNRDKKIETDKSKADLVLLKKPSRRGIQSIEIGFSILDVLCKANGPLPLRSIAQKCNMAVANVHNYLVSFQNVGVVMQESDTGFYGLGNYAISLGIAALQQFDVQKVARPVMAELGAITGFSVFLGVWGNKGPTIVYRVECAKNPPLMEMRVGSVLPLLNSALGRNFLSHLPEQMTLPITKEELGRQKTNPELILGADAPRSMDQVHSLIAKVRENGFSRCVDSLIPGYTAMSAPIYDQFGGIIAGLTIMGPNIAIQKGSNDKTILLLKEYTAQISKAAGWQAITALEK
jgi:DNA-binding IclR family transcriptional regulator